MNWARPIATAVLAVITADCSGVYTPRAPSGLALPQGSDAVSQALRQDQGCPCVYVTNAAGESVLAFPVGAKGDVKPVRFVTGPHTGLDFPTGVAFDGSERMYVTNGSANTVTVYAPGAHGDAKPIRVIAGYHTLLNGPGGISLDSKGEIFVSNAGYPQSITVYNAGASGDVSPIRDISGSKTHLAFPCRSYINASGDVFVADSGPANQGPGSILGFPNGANGNVAPTVQYIAGSKTGLDQPEQVAIGPDKEIYAGNQASNAASTVTVYASNAHGDTRPIRTIAGKATKLDGIEGIAIDGTGQLYVGNILSNSITVYAKDAKGNAKPVRTIVGNKTRLYGIIGLAIH